MNSTFSHVELFILLLAVTLALTALARRLLVPYPILLVIGGLVLGFLPALRTSRRFATSGATCGRSVHWRLAS